MIFYFCNKHLSRKNRHISGLLLFLMLISTAIPGLYGQKYIVDWAKTFTGTGWNRVTAITSDTSNNIILAGAFDKSCDIGQSHYNSRNFHDQVLVKYDSTGTVLWTKHFSSNLYTETGAILTKENGDIILAGTFRDSLLVDGSLIQSSKVSALFIASLAPAGNIKWLKILAAAPGIHANSICKDGAGNIYLSGSFREQTGFPTGQLTSKGQSDIFLAKVSPAGNMLWVKQIGGKGNDQPQRVLWYNQNIFLAGNYNRDIEVPVSLTSSEYGKSFIIKFSETGQLISTKTLAGNNKNLITGMTIDREGNIYTAGKFNKQLEPEQGQFFNTATVAGFVIKYSNNLNYKWTRIITEGEAYCLSGVTTDNNNRLFLTGTFREQLICNTETLENNTGNPYIFLLEYNSYGEEQWVKRFKGSTDYIPKTVMADKRNRIYLAGAFAGNGRFDSEEFLAKGRKDGFLVNLLDPCTLLKYDLQDEYVLCPGETEILDAGSGFVHYEWNNGLSKNRYLSVNEPGTYVITIEDGYGCLASDTVYVRQDTTDLILPENVTLCEGATDTLDAGGGFTDYNWQNGLSSNRFLPVSQPGIYTISVTDQYGCPEHDSVEVTIDSITILLPESIVLCETESTILDPGTGFASYNWNNGLSDEQLLNVSLPGTYTVEVTNSRGCTETSSVEVTIDSITIPLPEIFVLCETESTILDPGSGFASYNWNNGLSDEQLLNVSLPGTYTVEVTNSRGCTETSPVEVTIDSITIPLPEIFVLCETESTILDPGTGFASYNWNNGLSDEQLLNVSQPGTYTIEVTNSRGCTETNSVEVTIDSITIPLPEIFVLCETESTILDPGTGFASYNWNNGLSDEQLL
ncbi:MAG: SBBP repeat-containing protein, partial [Bacteroidetes bacterium]|nr:SBBP repeat-containing protein [Bacteroidota bacterium]